MRSPVPHGRMAAQAAAASFGGLEPVAPPSRLVVCFSHLRWDFVWQRPQHLLTRAARGAEVVMIEEPIFESGATPRLDVTFRPGAVRVAVPVLAEGTTPEGIDAAQRDLVTDFLAQEAADEVIHWYYTPMAIRFTDRLAADLVVYDNMDELSAFRGASPEMLANEAEMFRRADLVFTGGQSLFEAKRGRHPSIHAFPSSIDAAHFETARRPMASEPADQAEIPHPRIGFFGVIDERMDVDLVGELAARRPDWHLVMIGPVVKIDPATLPRRPNLHWLGHKSYEELPAYLAGWDAGFMPFALNESTRYISPTKTPEFLAAGLPLVSTPIHDVVRPYGERGLVEIAGTVEETVAAVIRVLDRDTTAWLDAVDRHLATGSWDRTWAAMNALIEAGLARQDRAAARSSVEDDRAQRDAPGV